jgi:chromosome partitioning protein
MGVSIVVSNQKGGVGKTVITVNLAEYAVEKRGRVLVVDVDGQGNTTRRCRCRCATTCGSFRPTRR